MAVADPTVVESDGDNTEQAAFVTASFTPAGNALLIAVMYVGKAAAPFALVEAPTDNFTDSGSWTEAVAQAVNQQFDLGVFWMITGATPGEGEITYNCSEDAIRQSHITVQIASGFDISDPFLEEVTDQNEIGTITVGDLVSIIADNLVLAGLGSKGSGDPTTDADFTQFGTATGGGASEARTAVAFDPDDDQVQCTFSDLDANDENSAFIAEIQVPTLVDETLTGLPHAVGLARRLLVLSY